MILVVPLRMVVRWAMSALRTTTHNAQLLHK